MAANLVSTHLVMCLNRSLSIHHPIWYGLNIWMMFCLFSLIDCYNSLLAPPETVPVEVRHQRAQTSWQEEVQMLFAALLLPPPTCLPAPTPRQRLVLLLHIRRRLSRASAHWIILWYKFFFSINFHCFSRILNRKRCRTNSMKEYITLFQRHSEWRTQDAHTKATVMDTTCN